MSKKPEPRGDVQPLQDLNRSFAQAETAFAARLQASVQRIEHLQTELVQSQQAHERERGTAAGQTLRIADLEAALTAATENAAEQAQELQSRMAALQADIDELARQGSQLESTQTREREQWAEAARVWRTREQALVQQVQSHESTHQRLSRDLDAGAQAIEALRSQGQARLGAAAQELQASREALAAQRREFDLGRQMLQQQLQHQLELAQMSAQAAQAAQAALLQSAQLRQQGLERDLAALTAGHQALQRQWQAATQAAALASAETETERGGRQQDQARAQKQIDALRAQCSQSDLTLKALRERGDAEKAAHAQALALATARLAELGQTVRALEARLLDQDRQHGRERGQLQAQTSTAQDELRQALALSQRQRDAQDAALQAERAQRAADLTRHADDRRVLKADIAEARQRSDRADQQRHRDLTALQALVLQRERQARALAVSLERLELQLSQRPVAPVAPDTPDTPDAAEAPAPADLGPPPPDLPTRIDAAATAASAQPPPSPISPSSESTPMDIQHVNQLLALRGAQFVRKTYSTLLGREPDPQGEAYFTQRVATQHDKVAILYEFATSAEATARPQTLAGLSDLIQLHHPRKGRMRRWLQRASQAMSASHRIEMSLDQLGMQTDDRLQNIESRLGALDARVEDRFAILAQETAQARAQLIGLSQELSRCAHEIAALPQLLSSQLGDLLASQAAAPGVAAAEAPAANAPRPSALALRLTAAHGAASFIEDLTRGLRASDEARCLSGRLEA